MNPILALIEAKRKLETCKIKSSKTLCFGAENSFDVSVGSTGVVNTQYHSHFKNSLKSITKAVYLSFFDRDNSNIARFNCPLALRLETFLITSSTQLHFVGNGVCLVLIICFSSQTIVDLKGQLRKNAEN